MLSLFSAAGGAEALVGTQRPCSMRTVEFESDSLDGYEDFLARSPENCDYKLALALSKSADTSAEGSVLPPAEVQKLVDTYLEEFIRANCTDQGRAE